MDDLKAKQYYLLKLKGVSEKEAHSAITNGRIAETHPDVFRLSFDVTLTKVICDAVDRLVNVQGLSKSAAATRIRRWGKESRLCTPQNINAALRKAGIRTRAPRSDAGISKDSFFFSSNYDDAPKFETPPDLAAYVIDSFEGDQTAAAEFLAAALVSLVKK